MSSVALLSSTSSSVSTSSDFSVDGYSNRRDSQEVGSSGSVQDEYNHSSVDSLRETSLPPPGNGLLPSNMVEQNSLNGSANFVDGRTGKDDEFMQKANNLPIYEERENNHFNKGEMDLQYWLPPETEDQENDMDCSLANFDDDDDEGDDGTKWGMPSSLGSFGEESSGSFSYKEEKQIAMDKVRNNKFKAVVHHLLKNAGVASSGKDGDNWVDIVTSLSWEAASFVKPDIGEGKAMDPDGYVKVKCVATGSRSESKLVRGMVFKKHAAHKHMPTNYKKPRLLLIQGALDLSLSGLSSFESMNQGKETLKSIMDALDMCNPNVILVEKTVSRDIQESILAKGMTLVIDMKLHRLQRVARCTGSSILSSDTLTGKKLGQCDSFHFAKFVEEHATAGESGKKPSKTLMFLDGCPTRLGCTILLKGTNSEELKKIKLVVQYAVLVAYHLILETAFLLDQRAMYSTLPLDGLVNLLDANQTPCISPREADVAMPEDSVAESDSSGMIDIHISNGFHNKMPSDVGLESDTMFPYEPYNPLVFSGFSSISASLRRAFGNNVPLLSSQQSFSTHTGINGEVTNSQIQSTNELSTHSVANGHSDILTKDDFGEEKALDNDGISVHNEPQLETQSSVGENEDQSQFKDGSSKMLNADSILILMSRRNSSTGSICEQSHFSHIKFYRNFDVPLGIFLRDNLLNQRLLCSLCGGSPEAHIYYYAHHNKQLTIQVKHFPMEKHLPGETDGKIWMWSRCGNCKPQSGNTQSTKRVLISADARGLSFGKFLELSLSNHLSSCSFSICGHPLHTDCLYFFGLGPMIAMLRYSPVTTYTVSLPPEKLKFDSQISDERLRKAFDSISNLYEKGLEVFLEIEKSLKDVGSRFIGSKLKIQGSLKEFSDIAEMLKQERRQFEEDLLNASKNWDSGDPIYKVVSLNRVQWDMLVASCVWDRRLHSLLSSEITTAAPTCHKQMQDQSNVEEDGYVGEHLDNAVECETNGTNLDKFEDTAVQTTDVIEVPIEGDTQGSSGQYSLLTTYLDEEGMHKLSGGMSNSDGSNNQYLSNPDPSSDSQSADAQNIALTAYDLPAEANDSNLSERKFSVLKVSSAENSEWIWSPFQDIRNEYLKDLQKGYSMKFEPVNTYPQGSRIQNVINDEGSRLHIPLGIDNSIVSDHEDELSSIVACALALLKDPSVLVDRNEDPTRERGLDSKLYEKSYSVSRPSSLNSSYWSSFGSFTSDGIYSSASGLDDSSLSSTNGLYLSDSLIYFEDMHLEVSMGLGKLPGKGKYSVVSLYASQFQDLRRRCCPSELDYIASISRCRNWDAKGGKSKSFFAKTLDDRFIIKEIKRTEYESFLEFAPHYFKYMKDCFEQGNQTCLAKILGIHQVTVRQKGGKETKHDLMVMENLMFGRNISRQYDLKGALHARLNSSPDGSGDVLLDQNFVNDMNNSPFYVGRQAKRNLQRAVWNDTTFLNSINVMDYSLLVGVDTQNGELVCGIIDYVRQYTWDKQLENWVKSSLVPRNQLPTVISPKEYKKRFRKFITTHFVSVPDHWCSQILSNSGEEDDSFHGKS
ncbi:putative 1-phosphatidylinositol-3-phosphate 5-kinase FAB1D [Daucus carota subsp. sativus]|uniref:putative 1-phosphatidylinositol-3-phosphate 5-kinase FAB1D n=1 Tax=Daucus carota subsp. sativus TaxID=79200 RepID=UPI0007EF8F63|nr:PREDICTED: putative 1-phosphatidylinositol-3-phosphate 5-kinase FAB1D [Daucus carota subsp. sativus]